MNVQSIPQGEVSLTFTNLLIMCLRHGQSGQRTACSHQPSPTTQVLGQHLGDQIWRQPPLPTQPSCWPSTFLLLLLATYLLEFMFQKFTSSILILRYSLFLPNSLFK